MINFGVVEAPRWAQPADASKLTHTRGAEFQHRASRAIRSSGKRDQGLTDTALAELSGIQRDAIYLYLRGHSRMGLASMQVLLEAVGLSAAVTFGPPAKTFTDLGLTGPDGNTVGG